MTMTNQQSTINNQQSTINNIYLDRKWIIFGLISISIFWTGGCQHQSEKIRPEPLTQDSFIQVYFNQNQAKNADYTDPYRQIKRRGDNLEQVIIDQINNANYTIDLAVQELNLPQIAQSLINRSQAGVKVKIVLENTYHIPWSKIRQTDSMQIAKYSEFLALADSNKDGILSDDEIKQQDALIMLENAGIPIIDDREDGSKGSGLMHHKFIVIDQKVVVTGSANFTLSDIHGDFANPENRGNVNHLLVINSPELAGIFTKEFKLMWGDGKGGKKDSKFGLKKPFHSPQQVFLGNSAITVKFSPNSLTQPWSKSTNGLIVETLEKSFSNVDLALFVFSEQTIADTLEKRHQQGVKIRALIDQNFAFQSYSEGLDLLGVQLLNQCRYEKNNRPWITPSETVGIANLPEGDKLHHKFAIIDSYKVITGSHNWSAAANYNNDETLLIIENPTVTAHFTREFERLYHDAILGVTPELQQKIEQTQQQCN
jgi:phosphatidylserine/phosphatidylglycerophosphate/cardiolipin synthase-like enzyme